MCSLWSDPGSCSPIDHAGEKAAEAHPASSRRMGSSTVKHQQSAGNKLGVARGHCGLRE